jgi:hypothetical protein
MRSVDVAWVNYFEAGVRKAKIADAGTVDTADYSYRGDDALIGNAAQLSISGDGLFVCAHNECDNAKSKLYFVDGAGHSQAVTLPSFPEKNSTGIRMNTRVGVSRVNGHNTAIFWNDSPKLVALADGVSDPTAISFLPTAASSAGYTATTSWAYSRANHNYGLALTLSHPEQGAFSTFVSLDPKADFAPLPTQSDLAEPPVACSASVRRDSLRIVSPRIGNTKRPVLIEAYGKAQDRWLAVNSAVIYGKPKEACASVLDARQSAGDTRAIIVMDDLEHSWLINSMGSDKPGLTWQPMSCKFDANANVPDSVQAHPHSK